MYLRRILQDYEMTEDQLKRYTIMRARNPIYFKDGPEIFVYNVMKVPKNIYYIEYYSKT